MPSPSGKEQARAEYVRGELQKLGLTDIRTDEMSNVSAVRKGTGGGPTVVFAAHTDTVFPLAKLLFGETREPPDAMGLWLATGVCLGLATQDSAD